MNWDEYQQWTATMMIPRTNGSKWQEQVFYTSLGLGGEAGEVLEKVKKHWRDGSIDHNALRGELGDVLFYLARVAGLYNISLSSVMEMNVAKIEDRRSRDVLHGEGDER